ncbi:DUF2076 domain-containing protein [Massilia terrae]|uniref:DUF2076 family protein n=1 Tax=Massilia terrae TaxID=1811224 RepID=A0ABT2D184_9BURK|nr:DUF2076 family protein [Massilia terrae]MCS0659983.1 DUF2076 family protein [Massilia terrae]
MTPQDSQLLQDFLTQLVQARGVAKDPQAEDMINRAASQQPDATYLLVQRALLMQQALNNARAEIESLQDQLRNAAPQSRSSFLDPTTWGNSGATRPSASAPPSYQQPAPASMQAQQQPATGGGFLSGRGGSMLGNIATTAAGVAGGAFLFQGLEHLLGAHAGNGFLGPQSALMSRPEETTIVNNYYEDKDSNRSNLFDDSDRDSSDSLLSDSSGNSDFDDLGPDDDDLFT